MEKAGKLAEIYKTVWQIDWNVNIQAVGTMNKHMCSMIS